MVNVPANARRSLINSPETLSPLPSVLHQGFIAVSVLGFLSIVSCLALFLHLAYRLATRKRRRNGRINQSVILIFNLIIADIQQSVAFLLDFHWVQRNGIFVNTGTCFAQGWFVSTGDLASAVFTLAIAIHSFADIVFDFRLKRTAFLICTSLIWVFIYTMAIIGISLHPTDIYSRSGAWCWINAEYKEERIWLHYFWIIIAEFSTIIIYTAIFFVLRRRVKRSYYNNSDTQTRAESAARLIAAYPIVFVICTLPLVIARLAAAGGANVTFKQLVIAAAMITSNGWLDVILYSITRRALIFGPELTNESARALDTFASNWRPDNIYGTTTIIEANHDKYTKGPERPCFHRRTNGNIITTTTTTNNNSHHTLATKASFPSPLAAEKRPPLHRTASSSRSQANLLRPARPHFHHRSSSASHRALIISKLPHLLPTHHASESEEELFPESGLGVRAGDLGSVKTETVVEVTREEMPAAGVVVVERRGRWSGSSGEGKEEEEEDDEDDGYGGQGEDGKKERVSLELCCYGLLDDDGDEGKGSGGSSGSGGDG